MKKFSPEGCKIAKNNRLILASSQQPSFTLEDEKIYLI